MKDKLEKIGTQARLSTDWPFAIDVKIVDYKRSYGRDRWLVTPVAGEGQAWVENISF